MIVYIKKLFTKWVLLLGLLPTFYDYISVYFEIEFILPSALKMIFIIIIFIIASFNVWNDEKKINLELSSKLKNPVDYQINAKLEKNNLNLKPLIQEVDAFMDSIDEKIAYVNANSEEEGVANYSINSLFLQGVDMSSIVMTKTKYSYVKELLNYKDELIYFKENYNSIKDNMVINISNKMDKLYKISFYIENIGRKSDSNIDIEIISKDIDILNNRIVKSIINKSTIKYPEKPEPPRSIYEDSALDRINNFKHPSIENPMAYRQNESIEKNRVSVTLRDMNVGDKILVTKNTLFIEQHNNFNMTFIVKSKQSQSIIKKNIILEHID